MKQRNLKIDQLKCLSAFLVIYVHCSPTGTIGENISAIARIAVPIFFIITGYFYEFSNQREKKQSQIKNIFVLCIIANFLYLIWTLLFASLNYPTYPSSDDTYRKTHLFSLHPHPF